MGKYNLLEEEWIPVITVDGFRSKKVSLPDIFENAENYQDLATDTKTQNFVILRLLLSILTTVFSRFDKEGKKYEFIELDENYKQIKEVNEDDVIDYNHELYNTWHALWESGKFPKIVSEYLGKWKEHFYLLDSKYPFFQVTAENISSEKLSKSTATKVLGKNINRLISESGNKKALFSPKCDEGSNKDILEPDEVTRWLLTFQGYSGLSDKAIFVKEKYKVSNSKGWTYDIGGIYIKGKTLFETLMLNLILVHPESQYWGKIQKPCWEFSGSELINSYLRLSAVDNLAQLYTNWSRAVFIETETDFSKPFSFKVVKLPEINHVNAFLEPMTLWRYNKNGPNKDNYTPRKHSSNQALWRSFGLISNFGGYLEEEKVKIPGIIKWVYDEKIIKKVGEDNLIIESISMKDDGKSASWVPTDEIFDNLNINDLVLKDSKCIGIINDVVDRTKEVIEITYRKFLSDIAEIRKEEARYKNQKINQEIEEIYSIIDMPFKRWVSEFKLSDEMSEKISDWHRTLENIVKRQVKKIIAEAGTRDYMGITVKAGTRDYMGSVVKKDKIKNIATSYNAFKYFLMKKLK